MKPGFMQFALEEARDAAARGEVPVGAVIVCAGEIVARAGNETRALGDVSAHAEVLAIRRASQNLGRLRLEDCDLYVTLEPCAMCAGLIAEARLRRVYFGATDPKSGGVLSNARVLDHSHHKPDVYAGIGEREASEILRNFFSKKR